jgi:hypothetical protein
VETKREDGEEVDQIFDGNVSNGVAESKIKEMLQAL